MSKLVVLNLGRGDLHNGFPFVAALLQSDSKTMQFTGNLPAAPELLDLYRRWQLLYELLYKARSINIRSFQAQLIEENNEEIAIDQASVTHVSDAEFSEVCQELQERIDSWLDFEGFRPIERQLRKQLAPSDEIRVIIETEDKQLRKIPWYIWQFFRDYPHAEVSLSSFNFEPKKQAQNGVKGVRILAILGDAGGIDIEADRRLLENLPDAETVFLVEPQRRELDEQLWDKQGWDLLFFAGHSSIQADGEIGRICINPDQSLTILQLRNALNRAIEGGLRVAIFNSCDGLGLARQLADLHVPQMIVMREPVPDRVAQEFLKHFLTGFADGHSFYLAVREARERLQGIEGEFPGASWLPVIFQNPAEEPPTWQSLCGGTDRETQLEGVATSEQVTMVFTDLVNSTAIKKHLEGSNISERNRLYRDTILKPHRQRVEASLVDYCGRVVEITGDAFFLVFPEPILAVQWAIATQISHINDPIPTPLGPLQVRIGMHTGRPLVDGEYFIGQEVDYAARVCALASGEQILLSEVTAVLVRNAGIAGLTFHFHGDRHLKGIGEVPIFELLWTDKQPQPLRTALDSASSRAAGSYPSLIQSIWHRRRLLLFSSTVATALVLGLQWLGMLQLSELQAFDQLMRQRRPYEKPDERILIVQATPEDIQEQEEKPKNNASLSEYTLAGLFEKLKQYEPSVIGLDIYRDFPADPAYPQLATYLGQEHFFGICKVRDAEAGDSRGIAPPLEIPSERLGFSDALADPDGIIRRHLLSMKTNDPTDPCMARNHLSFLVALYYLDKEHGIRWDYTPEKELQLDDPRSGKKVVLRKLHPFTGGYQRLDARGRQILLNYRSRPSPLKIAPTVSVGDILNDRILPPNRSELKGRIVLVGVDQVLDYWSTPYSVSQPKKTPGLFIQAHMVSQLLSAVLDNRPLLWVLPLWGEALWIWGWSVVGGVLACLLHQPRRLIISTGLALGTLYGVCYLLILQGGWMPLVPSAIALVLTAIAIAFAQLYQGGDRRQSLNSKHP